jgi:pSer/pThr/pTyr-binding forkhead associated (FHA) protein
VSSDRTQHTQHLFRRGDGGGPPAQIVVIQGPGSGTIIGIHGDEVSFGRHSDNDLVLDSQMISRHHGRLLRDGEQFLVEDLGSRNGILVNGRKMPSRARQPVRHKDVLQLSDCQLLFLQASSAAEVDRLATIHLDQSVIGREAEALLKKFLEKSSEGD